MDFLFVLGLALYALGGILSAVSLFLSNKMKISKRTDKILGNITFALALTGLILILLYVIIPIVASL